MIIFGMIIFYVDDDVSVPCFLVDLSPLNKS